MEFRGIGRQRSGVDTDHSMNESSGLILAWRKMYALGAVFAELICWLDKEAMRFDVGVLSASGIGLQKIVSFVVATFT